MEISVLPALFRVDVSFTCVCPYIFKLCVRFQNQYIQVSLDYLILYYQLTSSKRWQKEGDYSLQWLVMSQIFCFFKNKGSKVTDKQCGLSVCLSVSVWFNCACLCISNPPPVSVTFSGALCMEHAKRCCLADTTQFLDSMDSLNNVSIHEKAVERETEREREKAHVQDVRQRQICSYYLSTIIIFHHSSQKDFLWGKSAFREGWLKLQQLKSVRLLLRCILILQVHLLNRDSNPAKNCLGFPL